MTILSTTEKITICIFLFLLATGFCFANWGDSILIFSKLNHQQVLKKESSQGIKSYPKKIKKVLKKSLKKQSLISINKSDLPTLMQIKGIGKVIAARIIEYRKKKGFFKKVEDLLSVKGIGPKKFQKFLLQVCL